MPILLKEMEDTRWYQQEKRTIDGVDYYRIRVYKKTDRWRRVKDSWYKIEEPEPEEIWWTADFDIRNDYGR